MPITTLPSGSARRPCSSAYSGTIAGTSTTCWPGRNGSSITRKSGRRASRSLPSSPGTGVNDTPAAPHAGAVRDADHRLPRTDLADRHAQQCPTTPLIRREQARAADRPSPLAGEEAEGRRGVARKDETVDDCLQPPSWSWPTLLP